MKGIEDLKKPKNVFLQSLRNIENEDTKLLKLQKQYRSGKIEESEMSEEQVQKLCDLYDRQISQLEKSNEIRKQKLLEYRKKMKNG